MASKASSVSEAGTLRPVACLNCRNRRSYCSKDKPSCSRCRCSGLLCVYEGARKVLVNEAYLRDLERRAKAIDKNIGSQAVPIPIKQKGNINNINTPEDEYEDFEDEEPLLESFNHLSLYQPSTSFQGPASSDTFLRNVSKVTGLGDEEGGLDIGPNFFEPGTLPSKKRAFSQHVRLPPIHIARRFFAAQYSFIGPIFAFTVSKEEFESALFEAYNGLPDAADREACLLYAKLLLILAFGQLYSVNQWVDFRGPPGFAYFVEALSLLPETHEEGSLLCVETLALAGYFLQNMNRRDAAFQFIGRALRMAISLGLHHEVEGISPSHPDSAVSTTMLEDAAKERRRRVWWSVYSMDRILSVKSGNPITIQDEDIGAQLPCRLPSEPEYCPAIVLRQYTKLSRILGEIHTQIYRKTNNATTRSGKTLMASVQRIMLSLSNWDSELPHGLRFDPNTLSLGRESVSTLAHYYQCINMTVRPLLFHVVKKRLALISSSQDSMVKETDWKAGLSQTTVKVIEVCIGAALDNINIMAIAAQRDLVATYGYMDGEHIFSATIVLVMVCAAFPIHAAHLSAMNTGLGLLRGMAERGNSHIGARCDHLTRLLSTVMPSDYAALPAGLTPQHSAAQMAAATRMSFAFPPLPAPAAAAHAAAAAFASNPLSLSSLADGAVSGRDADPPRFPIIDMQTLAEPFYDEGASAGMDFGLWEEGFAYPTMDFDLDLAQEHQQQPSGKLQ